MEPPAKVFRGAFKRLMPVLSLSSKNGTFRRGQSSLKSRLSKAQWEVLSIRLGPIPILSFMCQSGGILVRAGVRLSTDGSNIGRVGHNAGCVPPLPALPKSHNVPDSVRLCRLAS